MAENEVNKVHSVAGPRGSILLRITEYNDGLFCSAGFLTGAFGAVDSAATAGERHYIS